MPPDDQAQPPFAEDLIPIPARPPGLAGVAPALLSLQRGQPIAAVRTPAGDAAWLCTRYEDVKALLGDNRLGRSHPDPAGASRYATQPLAGGRMANWDTEDADDASWRLLLAPSFSARRMNLLLPDIQQLTGQLLDQMAEMTPPVDFHKLVAFPFPAQVVGRVLGIPADATDQLDRWFDALAAINDPVSNADGLAALREYTGQLLQVKREQPGEDVFSDLLAACSTEPQLHKHAMHISTLLLFAGHETTVSMIDYGMAHLLTRPDLRETLLSDPSAESGVIEEILRCSFNFQDVLIRYARTELEIGGKVIRKGDLVLLSIPAANNDENMFPEPGQFDGSRQPNPHLSFGFGRHYCIGSVLARMELQIVLPAVFRRFPGLRLVLPAEELPFRDSLFTGGLDALPVTW
jgi:cytochrome P450